MQHVYLHISLYCIIILLLVKPLGWYIATVYNGKLNKLNSFLLPVEKLILRCCNVDPEYEMNWKEYIFSVLWFNMICIIFLYIILRTQQWLFFNPQNLPNLRPDLAFNTAISFVTNTNWQAYSPEVTMSYFTQAVGLTVQNFLSAATGMALLIAFIRGLYRQEVKTIGNYWVDMVRGVLYILLPLSTIFAIVLVSQGVIQNLLPYQEVHLLDPQQYVDADIKYTVTKQLIPMGPVASQEAIKLLGSNGGGFFNANSAHPFENPSSLTNFLEVLALIIIPAALCYTFGVLVGDRRQGWMILFAMTLILVPSIYIASVTELHGNPQFNLLEIDNNSNMEGKETRIGAIGSALWSTVTAATANGAVNSMIDSHLPLSTIVYLLLMHVGEIVFGGLGCGLYGMLMFVIITVFIAGLMVGRSPIYLGKKIEPFEMKMVALVVLVMPLTMLIISAIASVTEMGTAQLGNPGAHGFTEILYAFTSLKNNNGSAMAGLNSNSYFYNLTGGILMIIGRYWLAIPMLAVAGSLVNKKISPMSGGTLATNTVLFAVLLVGVVIIVGALSLLPTIALGPIVEHLMLWVKL